MNVMARAEGRPDGIVAWTNVPAPIARASGEPVNAMSVDVEDYFQVQAADRIDRKDWTRCHAASNAMSTACCRHFPTPESGPPSSRSAGSRSAIRRRSAAWSPRAMSWRATAGTTRAPMPRTRLHSVPTHAGPKPCWKISAEGSVIGYRAATFRTARKPVGV